MNRAGLLALVMAGGLVAGNVFGADTTTTPSDAQIQGRQLAEQILSQTPAQNLTNTGVLKIRGPKGRREEIPVHFETHIGADSWTAEYQTLSTTNGPTATLVVEHQASRPNLYMVNGSAITPADTALPFAGSDFWACDLGLEFFHWPGQQVLRKEIRRSRGCVVLESTNPNPAFGAYARVDSWIDTETDGIVHGEAWGANGRMVKEFDPKEFKKVNGQWELQEMEISNPQTNTRTRLEFNLTTP